VKIKIIFLTIKDIIADMFADEEVFKDVMAGCFGCALLILFCLVFVFLVLYLLAIIIYSWQYLDMLL